MLRRHRRTRHEGESQPAPGRINKLEFMIADLVLLSVMVLPAKSLEAQMPVQQRAEFEVASVKPSGSSAGNIGASIYPGGRVAISHARLELLIQYAFDIQPFQA